MKHLTSIMCGIGITLLFSASVYDNNRFVEDSNSEISAQFNANTIAARILPPAEFQRENCDAQSFAFYLRNLPLKEQGSNVKLFDGSNKISQQDVFAVIDLTIGDKDLQQSAEAILRLRAEYLWKQKRYEEIVFKFANGEDIPYSKWAEGYHIKIRGNKITWYRVGGKDYSYANFLSYLYKIFMYTGTSSLAKELIPVPYRSMQQGDVFLCGGNSGHAMIVVDIAVNPKTKQKCFIVAQSSTPAQDIHIVKNSQDNKISPWYVLDETVQSIQFNERSFTPHQLYRFKQEQI